MRHHRKDAGQHRHPGPAHPGNDTLPPATLAPGQTPSPTPVPGTTTVAGTPRLAHKAHSAYLDAATRLDGDEYTRTRCYRRSNRNASHRRPDGNTGARTTDCHTSTANANPNTGTADADCHMDAGPDGDTGTNSHADTLGRVYILCCRCPA